VPYNPLKYALCCALIGASEASFPDNFDVLKMAHNALNLIKKMQNEESRIICVEI